MTSSYIGSAGTGTGDSKCKGPLKLKLKVKANVKLKELDDSSRGVLFSNKKEDKLLEKRITYLTNQNKRIQTSINRQKEHIKLCKVRDHDMAHLDRRYKEAMRFILDYKKTEVTASTTPVQVAHDRAQTAQARKQRKAQAGVKNRIKSAPLPGIVPFTQDTCPPSIITLRRQAWISAYEKLGLRPTERLNRLSLEPPPVQGSSSDSEEEETAVQTRVYEKIPLAKTHKPVVKNVVRYREVTSVRPEKPPDMAEAKRQTLRRLNTKADFWSVLRQTKPSLTNNMGAEDKGHRRMKDITRVIMQEEKVIRLFRNIDRLKKSDEPDTFFARKI